MTPAKQNLLYANLMHEAKIRIDAINISVRGHLSLSEFFVREFCWLQLRMLCELVALSCLVAHGDITFLQSHKVGRSTSADDIMDRLTKLRPHFYPMAYTQQPATFTSGKAGYELTILDPSPLPKDEFLRLYGASHRHLHRGSLKGLLSMDINTPLDIKINAPEIVKWTQKLNDLLSSHVIAISEERLITCILRNAKDNNKVQVANAERGPSPKQ